MIPMPGTLSVVQGHFAAAIVVWICVRTPTIALPILAWKANARSHKKVAVKTPSVARGNAKTTSPIPTRITKRTSAENVHALRLRVATIPIGFAALIGTEWTPWKM